MFRLVTLLADDQADISWTRLRGFMGPASPPAGSTPVNTRSAPPPMSRMGVIVPIAPGIVPQKALLVEDRNRSLLVLQNNSTATAPDVAPTFYFGFGQQAQVGLGLALPPGVGLVLDVGVPIDSVYLTIGPFVNGGGTVSILGIAQSAHYVQG